MASNKEITQQAKAPDAFLSLSERVLKWSEGHIKFLLGFIAVFILGGAAYLLDGYFKNRAEFKAAQEIYNAEQPLNDKRMAFAKAENERLEKLTKEATEKKSKTNDFKPAEIDFDKELS
jgi:hypothetical protein